MIQFFSGIGIGIIALIKHQIFALIPVPKIDSSTVQKLFLAGIGIGLGIIKLCKKAQNPILESIPLSES